MSTTLLKDLGVNEGRKQERSRGVPTGLITHILFNDG